ncbi:class I glutamine amidotransferase-like protein [Apiosordaria backusii]|uniref:Class I glutamine amidotransferase-like protein n=1 Tax=Apiosordaria backusii TaxID=314023 RepID=A0AA40E613_9PEZI|nr:class I glutamine amidotransferase-like protein [Apiosordaria backusii]
MAPIRLAILEADTPVPQANAQYKGYLGVFTHLFTRAVAPEPLESVLTITGHDIVAFPSTAYPNLDEIDAVLITGSKYNSFDNDDWILSLVEFTRKALIHPRVKVIGVCFGHQIVARAMGCLVRRSDKGWEVSVTETTLTEKGKEIFGNHESLKIQQMHRDQVYGLPAGSHLLASTEKCPNHGFLVPNRVITIQGHPEFTSEIMNEILVLRHGTGLFTDEVFESGMQCNGDHHDGVDVTKVFIKFLQGEFDEQEDSSAPK